MALSTWTPDVLGTTSDPFLDISGVGAKREGRYEEIEVGWCYAWATIRCGPAMRRGNGIWRFTLPIDIRSIALDDHRPIVGMLTLGMTSGAHKTGNPHRCGMAGFDSNSHIIFTMENGLFMNSRTPCPGLKVANFHWALYYPCA